MQRLRLGLILVIAASGVLLWSDQPRNMQHRGARRRWNVHLLEYVQVVDVEEAEAGLLLGLQEAGLVRGEDYELHIANAHGDMATLTSMVDTALQDGADLLLTLSTPTLQTALRRTSQVPIVFTYVADPVAAGAGRGDEDHRPNITGIYTTGSYEEIFVLLRQCLPGAKRVGTLFFPSEVNTVYHKDKCVAAARKLGIEMIALPVSTPSEVPDAAQALCTQRIDAVVQVAGNLTASSFPSIARAAAQARLPIFAFMTSQAEMGASVVLARDYRDAARQAGGVAAQVLRGAKTADIPFQPFTRTRLILNRRAAEKSGLQLPPALLQRAQRVIGP